MKMVFIYVDGAYELGLAKADGSLKDPVTGMILTAENYCDMCLKNCPTSCPVIANVKREPQNKEEWKILTEEINKRYREIAAVKAFLASLVPPFKEPFNYDDESQDF